MTRVRGEERGVAAIMIAVSLIAIMAAAMLALDAGNLWSNRRNLVLATDATALNQARQAAFTTGTSCTADWQDALVDNAGSDVFDRVCSVVRDGASGTGYVIVEARQTSGVGFGAAVGVDVQQVFSLTAARFGYVTTGRGLRPMGICIENQHIDEWLRLQRHLRHGESNGMDQTIYDGLRNSGPNHPEYSGAGVVHRIYFTKTNPDACGGNAPGNWGWIDFNGGSNSNSENQDWVANGYDNEVGIGDCYADGTNQPCEATPGSAGGSVQGELQNLVDRRAVFHIPVFDSVTGNGANVRYNIAAFVGVRLWGFRVTGAESQRYFDFEFVNAVLEGNCCAGGGEETGSLGVEICGIDHDVLDLTARCRIT